MEAKVKHDFGYFIGIGFAFDTMKRLSDMYASCHENYEEIKDAYQAGYRKAINITDPAISEHEAGKYKLPKDFKCTWLTDLTDCVYRDKRCHICTKAGFEPEIKNHFAPFRKPE